MHSFKRSPFFWPSFLLALGFAGYGGAAIIQAIIPAAAPSTSRRGTTTPASGAGIFQLAANTTAGSAGAAVCDDGNGNTTTSGCTANAVTSTSPVTVNANSTSDQQLMELSLSAGYLNSLGRPFDLFGAGVYTTQTAQTPTLEFKIKLCTVSGCGSGTVVTLVDITTGASTAATSNVSWNVRALAVTAATGATGNLEVHGPASVDLGSAISTASTVYNDTATAVSSNIDLTAALFVDFTIKFSTNAATANICVQREGAVSPGGSTAGGGGSVTITPPYLLTGGLNYGPVWPLTIPPLTGWTQVNSPTSFDTTNGYPYLHSASKGLQVTGVTRTAPATPYSAIFTVIHDFSGAQTTNTGGNDVGYVLGWTDGTKLSIALIGALTGNPTVDFSHWTSPTAFSASAQIGQTASLTDLTVRQASFWKLCDDGTTLRFFWSIDGGNHWVASYTEGRASFLTAPTNLFWGLYPNSQASDSALIGYTTTGACP